MAFHAEKKLLILSVLLFIVIFIVGIVIYDDYGLSTDEPTERTSSFVNLKFILRKVLGEAAVPDPLKNYPELETYLDNEYGVLLQMPVALVEYFSAFSLDSQTVYKIRHLWVFLNFYLAAICFYQMILKRYKKRLPAILGLIFLVLSPRIFAESFYNIKDILFFSWFLISLFFLERFVFSPSVLNAVLLSVAVTIAANTRVVGFLVLLFPFLYLFALWLQKKIPFGRLVMLSIVFILVSGLLWIAFLPMAWQDPIFFIKEVIAEFSHYPNIVGELYLGNLVQSDHLPWHYSFVWLGATTPLFYCGLFLVGLIFQLISLLRKTDDFAAAFFDAAMIFCFFIPILLVIVMKSILYNGWRHLYFVYGPFLYIAVSGVAGLLGSGKRIVRYGFLGAALISCFLTIAWMIRNHPYQMVYFSPLFSENAKDLFSKDYWYLSEKECLEFIAAVDSDERIVVSGDSEDLHRNLAVLNPTDRRRFAPQYHGYGGTPSKYYIFNYTHTSGDEKSVPYYRPVYHVRTEQMKLATVFQREPMQGFWGSEHIRAVRSATNPELLSNLYDGDENSAWKISSGETGRFEIEIEFDEMVAFSGVTFYSPSSGDGFPRALSVYTSTDGKNWSPVEILYDGKMDYVIFPVETRYLRLENETYFSSKPWTIAELFFHQ